MGKRSNFKRRAKDRYLTFDRRAGQAIQPFLPYGCRFWEPCAGRGDLIHQLEGYGAQCVVATDVMPGDERIFRSDALTATREDVESTGATHIITNPPWSRELLHPMIEQFSDIRPTWLLFDADWLYTGQAAPFMPRLSKVVAIGRMCWIEGTKTTGKDNCAWYLFDARNDAPATFHGRVAA